MRVIGKLFSEYDTARIVSYLKQKGIEVKSDLAFDAETKQAVHQIWVLEEDQIAEALGYFQKFCKTPTDPEFDGAFSQTVPLNEEEEKIEPLPKISTPITSLLFALCVAIFFLNYVEEASIREKQPSALFLLTPIQALLLYDLPEPEITAETPYFRGMFDWLLLKCKGEDTQLAEGALFVKIREGQFWRLFSPCLLHTQFLHILFNMIWLWVLGRPIEQRIGMGKTLLLTLTTGVGSNTIQYLMGGPLFIGYSGVVMGLAGFIWVREKKFPWEGYPINKMTFLFLALFVLSILCLTILSFFLQVFAHIVFAPNIANAAHIAGGTIGAALGRLSYFAWHPKKIP